MTNFDTRRLDGDPTYAPGRRYDNETPRWRPTLADVKAGYPIKSYRLTGTEEEQAARCRDLTRELLRWRDGRPKVEPFTWEWIIARYKSDELSPIWDVKENTRQSYIEILDGWLESNTIASTKIEDTTFETLKRWKKAMEKNGRSVAFIHRRFTHLRIAAKYGLQVKPDLFRDVCAVLSVMRLRAPKPRTIEATSDQVMGIIAAADKDGAAGFALGLSLQWWLILRAVDVRGQWLGKGAQKRWADGLTWDMVDLDARVIRKMVSKTERHDDRPMAWDIAPITDLVDRLSAVPVEARVGPVVKDRSGVPFKKRHYSALWRKYARKAGVPDEVQMMDTRAGGANDALRRGAGRLELQHALNHKDGATTERYIRAREIGANNVIQMRTGTSAQRS